MDVATLKDKVGKDPVLSSHCFIVTWPELEEEVCEEVEGRHAFHPLKRPGVTREQVIDELQRMSWMKNIECMEVMGDRLLLVTANDPSKQYDVLFSVLGKGNDIRVEETLIDVISVKPVPAKVLVKVIGIPYLLAVTYTHNFMYMVAECLPMLSDIKIDDFIMHAENSLGVSGFTSNMVKTKRRLKNHHNTITFREF